MVYEALGKAHVPFGGDGEGVYSTATLGCFNVIAQAAPVAERALGKVLSSNAAASKCIRLADFGTADGGTSMPLLNRMIEQIKKHDPSKEVEITYEDQPNNDFKSLFFYAQGIKTLDGVGQTVKPIGTHPGVFVTVSGTSFFQQACPSESVHMVTSFTAMHWLCRPPGRITGGIHMTQLSDAAEKAKWAAQAAADWQAILLNRARELKPGGQMVLVNFGVSKEGYWLGHSDIGACMYSTMNKHWKAMADEGRITQDEYEATAFINYYRNEEEHVAPFQPGNEVHAAGLRLVSQEYKVTRCPFRTAWTDGASQRAGRDAAAHAMWYIPTLRTWSNSTFESALSDSRPAAERRALVDEMFQRYEDEVAAQPELHGMDYCHCYMHIEKVVQ